MVEAIRQGNHDDADYLSEGLWIASSPAVNPVIPFVIPIIGAGTTLTTHACYPMLSHAIIS